jgi:hypothetical protein
MTGDQSRLLKAGDRVRWKNSATDLETVTATAWSGVTISWDNGHTASIQHNDMAQVERAPVAYFMKRSKAEDALQEIKCPACDGTGFPKVKQAVEPGRRIFPAPCRECGGKGRIASLH